MSALDFRREALLKLQGKWGNVICVLFCYFIVRLLIGFVSRFIGSSVNISVIIILSLLLVIIQVPLLYGLMVSLFEIYKYGESKIFSFISIGFNNFGKSWGICFNIFLKLILPIILIILSFLIMLAGCGGSTISSSFNVFAIIGFILYIASIIWVYTKSYYYQLAYVIAADDETLTSSLIVQKSQYLMSGYRFKLFCLQLSFIGWFILEILITLFLSEFSIILASIASFVGTLILFPYIQFAIFAFYDHINPELAQTRTVSDEDIL
jgi:uncharacterized membrane protein